MKPNRQDPLLSVFMIAYNHEAFISQAINSILMQKVNFEYEIVIGEDKSTDRTREIILDYARRYPSKFKLLLHERNVGAMENQMLVLISCTGKYIAMLEGDDYWTDPLKLQKQVDFLEHNKEYVLSYHYCPNVIGDEIIHVDKRRNKNFDFNFLETLYGKNGYTVSMVFRKSKLNIQEYCYVLKNALIGDWPLELLLLSKGGKGRFHENEMAHYRFHQGGITKTRRVGSLEKIENRILIIRRIIQVTKFKKYAKHFLGELYLNYSLYQSGLLRFKYFLKGFLLVLIYTDFNSRKKIKSSFSKEDFLLKAKKRIKLKWF